MLPYNTIIPYLKGEHQTLKAFSSAYPAEWRRMGVPESLLKKGGGHIWTSVLNSIDAALWWVAYPDLLALVDPTLPFAPAKEGEDAGIALNIPLIASFLCYLRHPEARLWYAWCPNDIRDQLCAAAPTTIIERAMQCPVRLWQWRLPPQIKTHPKWFLRASSLSTAVSHASLSLQFPPVVEAEKVY